MALPVMRELAQTTREGVQLLKLYKGKALLVGQVESSETIRIVGDVGSLYDLHCTAEGKVLLAYLSNDEFNTVIAMNGLPSRTKNTITNIHILRRELEQIRRQGYATDHEEYCIGIRCAAAPIYNYNKQVIAALNISGLASRIDETTMQYLVEQVIKAAQKISK